MNKQEFMELYESKLDRYEMMERWKKNPCTWDDAIEVLLSKPSPKSNVCGFIQFGADTDDDLKEAFKALGKALADNGDIEGFAIMVLQSMGDSDLFRETCRETAKMMGEEWASFMLHQITSPSSPERLYGEQLALAGHGLLDGGANPRFAMGGRRSARNIMLRRDVTIEDTGELFSRLLAEGEGVEDLKEVHDLKGDVERSPLEGLIKAHMEKEEWEKGVGEGERRRKRKL